LKHRIDGTDFGEDISLKVIKGMISPLMTPEPLSMILGTATAARCPDRARVGLETLLQVVICDREDLEPDHHKEDFVDQHPKGIDIPVGLCPWALNCKLKCDRRNSTKMTIS
jgi:hypothetical protein